MTLLTGALTAADVTDVPDDADALRGAARRFANAADGVHSAATSGSRAWAGLPGVLTADALTPALAPLMDPAVQRARGMQSAADEFLRVATRAANSIDDLKHEHDLLVKQIDQFHASAPGQMEAQATKEAANGNILGAVATVITSWQQVPSLVADEASLRWRVNAHNDNVTSTLAGIAAQLDGIVPDTTDVHGVHTAANVTVKKDSGGGNWFEDAWNTAKTAIGVGGAVLGAEADAAWPYVQDAAATAGNIFASLGNAMMNHPDEVLELLGGLAMMAGGAAMEGGGVALDATGIGAIGGIPLNIAGAGVIAGGAAMASTGALGLGLHAATDDQQSPNRTDHVDQWKKEQNEKHPGRSKDGTYRSEGNGEARADAKAKEAEGVAAEGKRAGLPTTTQQVKATVDGAPNGRFFDGLMKNPDGTYTGIEIKSGTASRSAEQRTFDSLVSPSNPAYAKLNGVTIKITSVILRKVP
jgi:hypothetical protein